MPPRRNPSVRLWRAAALAGLLGLTGCEEFPRTRAAFAGATVNGQPVRLMLDTGAPVSTLSVEAARRFGLAFPPPSTRFAGERERPLSLTGPLQLGMGPDIRTVPLLVRPGDHWDGIIGWPEVRHNILVFDSVRRMILRASTLPPETAGWVKMKLHPGSYLGLDTTWPDGRPATLLIDTGAPQGAALPPMRWRDWRREHPAAATTSEGYDAPGVGNTVFEEVWATELQLGALTLRDVPVRKAVPFEVDLFNHYAGTLGMYALARLDLVIDGIHGVAYLRPRPPPGPPYPGISRPEALVAPAGGPADNGDWLVADDVRLDAGHLFLTAGNIKVRSGDLAGAIADFSRAIEFDPDDPDAYASRGAAKAYTGSDPTTDWDRALQLDPESFITRFNRAIYRQGQGRYAAALADFERALSTPPDGAAFVRLRLFRQLLLLRLGRLPAGSAPPATTRTPAWMTVLDRFAVGNMTETDFLTAAAKGSPEAMEQQQGEALYIVGMVRRLKGDDAGARTFWERCLARDHSGDAPGQFARDELARLDAADAR